MMDSVWMDCVSSVNIVKEEIPEIVSYRRAHHADVPRICQMMRAKNYDLFGDVEPGQLFERACLSLVQINEKQEVVSNVSLCNFPNVPALAPQDWLEWITMHYGLPGITERNTLFIHLLVWDCRYEETFFKTLLQSIFAITSYCLHVIIVVPPGLAKENVKLFKNHMSMVSPTKKRYCSKMQTLYVGLRHQQFPKLQIRRVVSRLDWEPTKNSRICSAHFAGNCSSSIITSPSYAPCIVGQKDFKVRQRKEVAIKREEDNDDLVAIIDAESKSLRALYGDFYISEMIRHPGEGNRQLIVAESDGLAAGVMCLNRVIDVDLLDEVFELGSYNALRKPLAGQLPTSRSSTSVSVINNKATREGLLSHSTIDRVGRQFSLEIEPIMRPVDKFNDEVNVDDSSESEERSASSSEKFGLSPSAIFATKRGTSVFAEAMNELPLRNLASSNYKGNDDDNDVMHGIPPLEEERARNIRVQSPQGEVNGFALELFSMNKKIDEEHALDYLEAAFACFPDLDYCVMLLPSIQPFFPFLENFSQVPLRFDKDFPMVLYVAHRATLLGLFQSREAVANDLEIIEAFLLGIPKKKTILEDFDAAVNSENGEKKFYVFTCEDRLIGLSILCEEPHIDQLRIMYKVEEYISMKNTARDAHARLLHFILIPVFSTYQRYFFRELMRLSNTTAIYYRLYDSEMIASNRTQPLVACLDAMIPVKSRTSIYNPWPESEKNENPMNEKAFSLFLMNPRLAMLPKRAINAKIVIVGASDCGIALAEFLALQSSSSNFVHFTNLTLVSPNGLPFERKGTLDHATMIPFRGRYCYAYRQVVPTRVWVNVVHGTVSHINRKDKHVTIFGLGNLSYDYLVLTCGLRYHSPRFNHDDKGNKNRGSLQQKHEMIPYNCFCINDDVEASTCLEKLKQLTNDLTAKKSIVLYGHDIHCYCTLGTLLKLGIPGAWMVLIQPKLASCEKQTNIFFKNDEVEDAVENAIRDSKIQVFSGWDLENWILGTTDTIGREGNRSSIIKSLTIQFKTEKKSIPCDALIYFGKKSITTKTFMAISEAGLVFDGRLVIDPEYRTNDPHIFAAGSITKYSRKYHAEDLQHENYNSIEIGERLAASLTQKIDSHSFTGKEENLLNSTSKNSGQTILPVFRAPIVVYCLLPGGFHYLHVGKPGKRDSNADCKGADLVTGSASTPSEIGYFSIHLNQHNRIETITCLRKKAFRAQDLITLYGKHDSMLNNLTIRFQNSLVPDLYAYFDEPWAAALFHDKFDYLRVENRATLLSKIGVLGDSLVDDATTALIKSDWKEMKEKDRRCIELKFQGSVYQMAISSVLVNFLQAEEELLPMYCNPRKLRRQLIDEAE